MIRFYLTPAVADVRPTFTNYKPAHREVWSGVSTQSMGWGFPNYTAFLLAGDVSQAQHNAMAAFADVSAFPPNLDNQIGLARDTVVNALEQHNIPANWVRAGQTYRILLRVLTGMFLIAQKFKELDVAAGGTGAIVRPGITLNTAYEDMPVGYRQRLVDAVDALHYDRSELDNQSTLRELLYEIGSQASPIPWLGTVV